MYYLFLDDERVPRQVVWTLLPQVEYDIVRSYNEFVSHIEKNGLPEFVTFDHDLADEHYVRMMEDSDPSTYHSYRNEKTGYHCAQWLVDYCCNNGLKFPKYDVHSMNNVGAIRIHQYIHNAKKHLNI